MNDSGNAIFERPLGRAQLQLALRLASLLESGSGIVIPEPQLDALLYKVASIVPPQLTLAGYVALLGSDSELRRQFVERMCTHETRFFRHAEQFGIIEHAWVAARRERSDRRRVRAWSVACSSGEEPFSLAMMLLDHFPAASGWTVEVVGTDLSTQVLARAHAATWPVARAAEIAPERLDRYMLRGHGASAGLMRATPMLRSVVSMRQLNLVGPPYSVVGEAIDLVLLRNVLIYFSKATRLRVVEALLPHLAPGAWLVTGPSEGVSHLDLPQRLQMVAPHIFEVLE